MVRDTAVADGGSPDPAADILSYRRRLLLLLLTAAFAAAMTVMARLLGADGIGVADLLLLACFALMLPWNLLGLGNAAIGLWLLATHGDAAGRVTPVLGSLPPGSPFLGGPVRARVSVSGCSAPSSSIWSRSTSSTA